VQQVGERHEREGQLGRPAHARPHRGERQRHDEGEQAEADDPDLAQELQRQVVRLARDVEARRPLAQVSCTRTTPPPSR